MLVHLLVSLKCEQSKVMISLKFRLFSVCCGPLKPVCGICVDSGTELRLTQLGWVLSHDKELNLDLLCHLWCFAVWILHTRSLSHIDSMEPLQTLILYHFGSTWDI